jgi:thioredoxin:protein disulfide reductase
VRTFLIAIGVLGAVAIGHAQIRRPKADVTPIVESDGVHAGTDVRVALQVGLPEGLHVQSNKPREKSFIPTVLSIDAPAGVTVAEIVYPASVDLKQAGVAQPLAVFEREFAIGVRLTLAAGVPPGALTVPARLRYQACDATMCYLPVTADASWTLRVVAAGTSVGAPAHGDVFTRISFGRGEQPSPESQTPNPEGRIPNPESRIPSENPLAALDNFTVLGTPAVGYMRSAAFLQFIHDAETGVPRRGLFEGRGPLAILLLVFLGGLALNLTPCVLPMIPINLAIIGAGTQAGGGQGFPSRSRGFLLGAAYGGGMAIAYGILGLVVILTAGTFGTINASPWFNAAIAVLFVALALAMFDVITIDFSKYSYGLIPKARTGTFVLAFSMGAVAALLAGACVAPVVIEVVLFSSNLYAKGTAIALGLPFFLGIGMAVPWPLAGAGIAALPKPGAWMVRVKQVFGVLILATAIYYGYEAYSIVSSRWVDAGAVTSSVEQKLKSGWHASLAEGLDTARRDSKPVLIDMWATWCKNCLTMDKTTLEDPAVISALAAYVKIKFQAEDPDDPLTKAVMQRFNAVGLPTYVLLRPKIAP